MQEGRYGKIELPLNLAVKPMNKFVSILNDRS